MTRTLIIGSCLLLPSLFGASAAYAVDVAKYVTAEEITGVVVEAGTAKPIPNAIVAIRFQRNNTGHSGPHCFRSMAIQADSEGRFRFKSWTQENTQANATYGEISGYKAGYAVPWRGVDVTQSRRTLLGIPFSDTITIPRTDVRLKLKPFAGSDQERVWELKRLVALFTCRSRAEFNDSILLMQVREEIRSSPIANQKLPARGATPSHLDATPSEWIEAISKQDGLKQQDPRQ